MFYSLFQLISLTLNLCLCIDLILTICDPFSPAYRRTKLYYLFSGTVSVFAVLIIYVIQASTKEKDCIGTTGTKQFVSLQNSANLVLAIIINAKVDIDAVFGQ